MNDTIGPMPDQIDQQQLAQQLVEAARADGIELVGPDGLVNGLTKSVLETALDAEMSEHLGYEPHDVAGRDGGNSRNGTRTKTVLTEIGPVEIEVPRDRDASFSPTIVPKRRRRLDGIDEIVLSLTARGLTTGEVAAHFDQVYGATVSKDTISRITDKVLEDMAEWQNRPLDRGYPVIFIDAINVKVRDGQVTNRPFYVVIGVTVDGRRDILGIWAGDGGEVAKYWLAVLTEIKNRGTADVCIAVCDGLPGLGEAITAVWPQAVVQTCVLHLSATASATPPASTGIRSPRTCARSTPRPPRRRPRHGSPSSPSAGVPSTRRSSRCGATPGRSSYRSSTTTWRSARSSAPRTIESLNARYRRAVRARDTSRPSKPPSSASTWSPARWTRPGRAGRGGRCAGSRR